MNDHPWLGQRAAPRHGQGTFRRRVWGKTGVRTPGETLALDRRVKMGPFVHAQEAQDMSPSRPSVICRLSLNFWPLVIMVIARGAQGRARTESVSRSLRTSDAHAPARRSKASPRPMPRGLRLESTRRPADATFSLCQHPRRSRASEAAAVCPYTDLKRQHHTPAAFPTAPPYSLQLHTGISRNGAAFREQNSVGPDCLAPMLNMRSTSKVS